MTKERRRLLGNEAERQLRRVDMKSIYIQPDIGW